MREVQASARKVVDDSYVYLVVGLFEWKLCEVACATAKRVVTLLSSPSLNGLVSSEPKLLEQLYLPKAAPRVMPGMLAIGSRGADPRIGSICEDGD